MEQTGSRILDYGRTPQEWESYFSQRGISIKADTIRKKANEMGARHKLFGQVLITGEQMDQIAEDVEKCRSNHTSEEASIGHKDVSNITDGLSQNTSEKALAHLQKAARGTSSKRSRKPRAVVTSLETKRRK
jgi:hypothetical protein